jgi:hypothetical protein
MDGMRGIPVKKARPGRRRVINAKQTAPGTHASFRSSEGEHYRELAAALGMSEGTVKSTVHRMRHRFGEKLRAESGAADGTGPAPCRCHLPMVPGVYRHAGSAGQ